MHSIWLLLQTKAAKGALGMKGPLGLSLGTTGRHPVGQHWELCLDYRDDRQTTECLFWHSLLGNRNRFWGMIRNQSHARSQVGKQLRNETWRDFVEGKLRFLLLLFHSIKLLQCTSLTVVVGIGIYYFITNYFYINLNTSTLWNLLVKH